MVSSGRRVRALEPISKGVFVIDKMHDYLTKEMAQNKHVDSIFMLLGIVFNLMMLAINSAAQSSKDQSFLIVFFALGVLVTTITVAILLKGNDTRDKLMKGLVAMYEDNDVIKYLDKSIMKNDAARNRLEIVVIVATCVTSIVIPILLKITYKGEL